jgi:chromosome partitioning protein
MKTVAMISQKGGTGKTTLSLHLAVAAERQGVAVAVLDLDPQTSAADWKDSRADETPSVISIQPNRLSKALDVARDAGAGLVIIDCVAGSPDVDIAAAEIADLILIPCRPRSVDLRAIRTSARIVKLTGKPAFVVLNTVPPNSPRIIEDAQEAVKQYGVAVATPVIHQRSPYGYALDAGQTAHEYEPDGKAAKEIDELFNWLRTLLNL